MKHGEMISSFFRRFTTTTSAESTAYRRSMFRRPPTINPPRISNSCSFIGTVAIPITPYAAHQNQTDVYTFLNVQSQGPHPSKPFSILIYMRGDVAQKALAYLKPNDLVYVHGPMGSFEKVHACGKRERRYKVFVKELNFVEQKNIENPEKHDKSAVEESPGECCREEKYQNRLYLWQVFFAKPYEWWDNRRSKRSSKYPDFKHKDTGECLWLSANDPPWLKRQLEIYDSKMAPAYQRDAGRHSKVRQCDIKELM